MNAGEDAMLKKVMKLKWEFQWKISPRPAVLLNLEKESVTGVSLVILRNF